MQLIKYELYKIFSQKIVWISLIIMLGMSYLSLDYPYTSNHEKELYKKWEGPLTVEKIESTKFEYNKLLEKAKNTNKDREDIYSDEETMELWLYQKIILSQKIENNVEVRLDELQSQNEIKSKLEKDMLEKIKIDELTHHTGPAQSVSFVEFGSALVLATMVLIGISPIYSKEHSSGVDNYILSSTKGKRPLAWSKICATIIFTVVIVFVWESFNLVVNFLQHGLKGWETPIQLITLYMKTPYVNSPYAFTMLNYHVVQIGIHLIGAIAFALLVLLISSFSKSSLTTFLIGCLIFVGPIFLGSVKWLSTPLEFSFTQVLRVEFLFNKFKTIDIFGYPILYPVFAVIVMLTISIICIRATLSIINNKEVT
ncbi:MAG: hypothetical protein K0S34_974 [Bacillales bacterium]|nr:hypothetical protein [Bacillales bacterium]